MPSSLIKRTLVGAVLSLALSFQLVSPAAAATNQEILTASNKGIAYLAANQGADGGVIGLNDLTPWTVIAVVANGGDPEAFASSGVSAMDYLLAHPLTTSAPATHVEKRILALAAAGKDTTAFGGVNYNTLFASYHNNNQIGNPILLNDDIFGLIAAAALNDPALQTMAQDALDYMIAHQDSSGGFSFTTNTCSYCGADSNDTAAAIIALLAAENLGLTHADLADAKTAAIAYLLGMQQSDGGFSYDQFSPSDGSSTAWGLMALNALGSTLADEASAARAWLLENQNTDGGFSYGAYGFTDSETYTTAHAVIALLGTTWLLQPEPLQHPVAPPTTPPPTPTPVQQVTISSSPQVNNPNPPKTTAAPAPPATLSETTAQPSTPADTTPAPTPEAPAAETKKSGPNFALISVAILILVAVIWFILQSKSSAGKK